MTPNPIFKDNLIKIPFLKPKVYQKKEHLALKKTCTHSLTPFPPLPFLTHSLTHPPTHEAANGAVEDCMWKRGCKEKPNISVHAGKPVDSKRS